eukprot:756963-Hanusia_phi.AAC.1
MSVATNDSFFLSELARSCACPSTQINILGATELPRSTAFELNCSRVSEQGATQGRSHINAFQCKLWEAISWRSIDAHSLPAFSFHDHCWS